MISQVSVCNSALVNIGADRISSIDQDTKRAILLKAIYAECRDAVLRAHPWHFAVKRVTLAPNGTIPDWGFDFQYDEPNDCLRLLETSPDDICFELENGKILTNENTLNIKYIFRQDDESSWDSCFAEAFGWKLSGKIAYAITQSITLVQTCEGKYKAAIAEARWASGVETPIKGLEADVWTNARRL